MTATEHLDIIYERLASLEADKREYGLRVFALNHSGIIPLSERFKGLDKLKQIVKKAREIQAPAIRIFFYNTADIRSKESSNPETIAFDENFNKPTKEKEEEEEKQSDVEHRRTLIDNPEKAEALRTLGGIDGLVGFTQQISSKDNEIAMLKMQHNYEKDRLQRDNDQLRQKILEYADEKEKLEKKLEDEQNEKNSYKEKNEQLAGIEERMQPRQMVNEIGAQVLTNFAEKIINQNPDIAGLMGLNEDEPEMEEAEKDKQNKVEFEESKLSPVEKTVHQIAATIKQYEPQYISQIAETIKFMRDIDERHNVVIGAINSYINNLKGHNDEQQQQQQPEDDSENND